MKIAERSLEWLIQAYNTASDKKEIDDFAKDYLTVVLEKPDLISDYLKKYDLYKGE